MVFPTILCRRSLHRVHVSRLIGSFMAVGFLCLTACTSATATRTITILPTLIPTATVTPIATVTSTPTRIPYGAHCPEGTVCWGSVTWPVGPQNFGISADITVTPPIQGYLYEGGTRGLWAMEPDDPACPTGTDGQDSGPGANTCYIFVGYQGSGGLGSPGNLGYQAPIYQYIWLAQATGGAVHQGVFGSIPTADIGKTAHFVIRFPRGSIAALPIQVSITSATQTYSTTINIDTITPTSGIEGEEIFGLGYSGFLTTGTAQYTNNAWIDPSGAAHPETTSGTVESDQPPSARWITPPEQSSIGGIFQTDTP